jgi:hypothetical protein
MSQLPYVFLCSVSGPNTELYEVSVYYFDKCLDVKKSFSKESGYAIDDLKILFGDHELTDTETLEDLVPLGFTDLSQLSVELLNPMKIVVQTNDGNEYPVLMTPKFRLERIANKVCGQMNIPTCLGEISVGGCKCDQYRILNEMDISEGDVVKFDLCPLGELIFQKESISASIIEKAISYVETVPFVQLEINITLEFLCSVKRVMEGEKGNREISGLLKRLILSIAYRDSISTRSDWKDILHNLFEESGLLPQLEEESRKIVDGEGGCCHVDEEEKEETIPPHSLMLKGNE